MRARIEEQEADRAVTSTGLDEQRWRDVRARARCTDGRFVYAVATTGIFCRPGCASRRPNRANVRFFDSAEEAAAAGFRPCLRCRPTEVEGSAMHETIIRTCALLADAEDQKTWEEIAEIVGVSPAHLHRRFRKALGITPSAYRRARRAERLRSELANGEEVASAIYGAGYGSSGRAYERAGDELGMTPAQYRKGGRGRTIRYGTAETSVGWVLAARTERGVCAVELGDSPEEVRDALHARFPCAEIIDDTRSLGPMLTEIVHAIEHPGSHLTLPLDVQGTAFQEKVWSALRAIPMGETATYGEIAERIGSSSAVRAVAGACGANPLAVIVPCHRVLPGNGGSGGYRWGVARKQRLLEREGASTTSKKGGNGRRDRKADG